MDSGQNPGRNPGRTRLPAPRTPAARPLGRKRDLFTFSSQTQQRWLSVDDELFDSTVLAAWDAPYERFSIAEFDRILAGGAADGLTNAIKVTLPVSDFVFEQCLAIFQFDGGMFSKIL